MFKVNEKSGTFIKHRKQEKEVSEGKRRQKTEKVVKNRFVS